MLLVVVYLYVASAVQWAMNAWVTFAKIQGLLMVPADIPFQDRPGLAEGTILKVVGVQEALFDFNVCAGLSHQCLLNRQAIRWPSETLLSFGALGPSIRAVFDALPGIWQS